MGLARRGACVVASMLLLTLLPACPKTANVSDVFTSLEGGRDARRRNVFYTDTQEIHCVVEVGNGRDDVTLDIVLRQIQSFFPQGKLQDVDYVVNSEELHVPHADGPQYPDIRYEVASPNGQAIQGAPYPVGRFVCEAYLDGQMQGSATFNVQFPDNCPAQFLTTGSPCVGFYEDKRQCPIGGASAPETPPCTCDYSKAGWVCPQL